METTAMSLVSGLLLTSACCVSQHYDCARYERFERSALCCFWAAFSTHGFAPGKCGDFGPSAISPWVRHMALSAFSSMTQSQTTLSSTIVAHASFLFVSVAGKLVWPSLLASHRRYASVFAIGSACSSAVRTAATYS